MRWGSVNLHLLVRCLSEEDLFSTCRKYQPNPNFNLGYILKGVWTFETICEHVLSAATSWVWVNFCSHINPVPPIARGMNDYISPSILRYCLLKRNENKKHHKHNSFCHRVPFLSMCEGIERTPSNSLFYALFILKQSVPKIIKVC